MNNNIENETGELEIIELEEKIDSEKEPEEIKPEEKKNSMLREIIGTIVYMAVVMCVILLFIKFVAQRTCVDGTSMNDTLQHGDNLMVDKLSYRFTDPDRFDIIVFPYEHKENTYYIKRIIGMPGETVQVKDGKIYINGEVLEEPYGKEPMEYPGIADEPITLAEDEYFVLGDNRNNSSDSRDPSVGNIHRERIVGKAFIRIWPLDEFGILKHQ